MGTMDEPMKPRLRNDQLIKMIQVVKGLEAIQHQLRPRSFRLLQQMVKQQWLEGSHIAWISSAKNVQSC